MANSRVLSLRRACDIKSFFLIAENIISEAEENAIVRLLQPKLQRKRYEGDHWDSVITKYKETELPFGNKLRDDLVASAVTRVIQFLREATQMPNMTVQPPHVIDLAAEGHIGPHVDGYKFSGGLVAGLSLLSSRPIRLRPNDQDKEDYAKLIEQIGSRLPIYNLKDGDSSGQQLYQYRPWSAGSNGSQVICPNQVPDESETGFEIEAIIPRRSVYMMTGPIRYSYTHEILGPKDTLHLLKASVPLERRLSVIFRDDFSL